MTSETSIKHMHRRDVASVLSLVTREFAFDAKEVEPRIREQIKGRPGQLERDRRPNLVLEIDGQFAGYATAKPFEADDSQIAISRERGSTAVLVQVAVEPAFRRRGGGAALTRAATDACRDAGYAQIFAHIAEVHAPFYRSLGFDVPAAGHGWSWVETHTADDVNLAYKMRRDNPQDRTWVPVLVETPSVEGYPVIARLLFKDLPASVTFDPRPGEPSGLSGVRALARQIESENGWEVVPAGAAVELRKYLDA